MKQRNVLLVDMMNLFVRNFSSLPFSNDDGKHVGGIFGCLNSFNMLVNRFHPDVICAVWEGKGSSKRRRELMEEYKAGRKFTGFNKAVFGDDEKAESESFSMQLTRMREYIKILPFYQLSVELLEADDVIAYLCHHFFSDDEWFNIAVTTDKDYYQIVSENTNLFRPVKTKESKTGVIVDEQAIMDEYGCHPHNFPILKAIAGDKSDGIDGMPRVGMATAVKDFPFLSSLKDDGDIYTIEDILTHAKTMLEADPKRNAKYSKYIEQQDLLYRNFKLMQLLRPNMSSLAQKQIHQTFTNYTPRFDSIKFRMMLMADQISPRNIQRWVDGFSYIVPLPIE